MSQSDAQTGAGSVLPMGGGSNEKNYSLTEINGWRHPIQAKARTEAIKKHEELEKRAKAARENPAEAKQAYDASRNSILGNLSNEPAGLTQDCLRDRKAASRRERKALIDKAIVSCPSCATEAVRLRQDMDEVENMRCAKHVYLANDPLAPADLRDNPPPGFLRPTNTDLAQLGLTRDMLEPEGTNFRAGAYIKDPKVWAPPDPPDPRAVIAFRGSTPALEDWENNMMQGANADPGYIDPSTGKVNESYYKRAVEIGAAVGRSPETAQFVGHSLGGGLASAAQGGSGGPKGISASTYNAAGLNSNTVAKYAGAGAAADPKKIKAIRVKGEALTMAQESDWSTRAILDDAVGEKRDLQPAHDKQFYLDHQGKFDKAAASKAGDSFDEKASYSTQLHSMDEVIAAMEAQKQADQKKIEDCLNSKKRR